MFELRNSRFITTVERPLLDSLWSDETCIHENSEMLTSGWLRDPQLLSDKDAANAVDDKITIDLRWEVCRGVFEPLQYLQSFLIRQGAERYGECSVSTQS